MNMKFLENIKIEKLWHGGIWLANHTDGRKIIIKWWPLPWSIVDIRIIKSKKDYIEWHISKIHHIDPEYADGEIKCPHYIYEWINKPHWIEENNNESKANPKKGCGWCKRQIINYNKQLIIKKWLVEESFDITNKSENTYNISINNPIPSPKIRWYRNKIEFSFGKYIYKWERLSEWSLWFHKQGEFAKIVDIDECLLIDSKLNQVYVYLKDILTKSGFDVYDQKFHKWIFRHLMMRQWQNTDQVMAILAISDKNFKSPNDIFALKDLIRSDNILSKYINTFVLATNNGLWDIIFAPDSKIENLWWDWYIYEELNINNHNLKFKISPQSFFQTNTSGAEVLFDTWINILLWEIKQPWWTLLDLYCGAGTIWLAMMQSGLFDKLIWIDVTESSIRDANQNADINNMSDRSEFFAGKAESIVNNLKNLDQMSAIVIDPPREWLHPDVIKFLINMKKKTNYKLLYISCNPVTMARDIDMLLDSKLFAIDSIQPMDMFPHTHHIENIWLLI